MGNFVEYEVTSGRRIFVETIEGPSVGQDLVARTDRSVSRTAEALEGVLEGLDPLLVGVGKLLMGAETTPRSADLSIQVGLSLSGDLYILNSSANAAMSLSLHWEKEVLR